LRTGVLRRFGEEVTRGWRQYVEMSFTICGLTKYYDDKMKDDMEQMYFKDGGKGKNVYKM
jgi:hypothetical protein